MGLGIASVRVDEVELKRYDKKIEVVGKYSLISENGSVLATQNFNGYSDLKITSSRETLDAMESLERNVEQDIIATLGIRRDEE
jgi:hypothetical protein